MAAAQGTGDPDPSQISQPAISQGSDSAQPVVAQPLVASNFGHREITHPPAGPVSQQVNQASRPVIGSGGDGESPRIGNLVDLVTQLSPPPTNQQSTPPPEQASVVAKGARVVEPLLHQGSATATQANTPAADSARQAANAVMGTPSQDLDTVDADLFADFQAEMASLGSANTPSVPTPASPQASETATNLTTQQQAASQGPIALPQTSAASETPPPSFPSYSPPAAAAQAVAPTGDHHAFSTQSTVAARTENHAPIQTDYVLPAYSNSQSSAADNDMMLSLQLPPSLMASGARLKGATLAIMAEWLAAAKKNPEHYSHHHLDNPTAAKPLSGVTHPSHLENSFVHNKLTGEVLMTPEVFTAAKSKGLLHTVPALKGATFIIASKALFATFANQITQHFRALQNARQQPATTSQNEEVGEAPQPRTMPRRAAPRPAVEDIAVDSSGREARNESRTSARLAELQRVKDTRKKEQDAKDDMVRADKKLASEKKDAQLHAVQQDDITLTDAIQEQNRGAIKKKKRGT